MVKVGKCKKGWVSTEPMGFGRINEETGEMYRVVYAPKKWQGTTVYYRRKYGDEGKYLLNQVQNTTLKDSRQDLIKILKAKKICY